jgi:hypothetical protein
MIGKQEICCLVFIRRDQSEMKSEMKSEIDCTEWLMERLSKRIIFM